GSYSAEIHAQATIEQLAQGSLCALEGLIAHGQPPEAGGYTPSDFPLAQLDQATLDRLLGTDRQVADLYPLAPLQQGILFHSRYQAGASMYIGQFVWMLEGALDCAAFQRAWQQVADRHAVFRTAILS